MSRSTLVLGLLCGALAGALGTTLYHQSQPTDEARIRAIVSEAIAGGTATAALDPSVINPMIEAYLMSDPRVLQRLSSALDTELRTEQREASRVALASAQEQIYSDPANIVLGNPEGDVTLVELFDYNCSFCRNALPDLAELLESDPGLKVVLKEFPILSRESVEAARVALVVAGKDDIDYWAFHEALFTSRGQVSGQTALAAAQQLGLSPVSVELDMQSQPVTDALTRTVALARQLNITGTPTYILGDEIIPGAVGIETLREKIANIRACGSTQCNS
ncbi:MAG: DsbA family protein [Devosia sp.]